MGKLTAAFAVIQNDFKDALFTIPRKFIGRNDFETIDLHSFPIKILVKILRRIRKFF